MCYGGKTKDLELLVLQCLRYRGKRYGLCLQRVKGLDEKTGHIWTVKVCVRTQCVCWMCPEGWYLHVPDCLWDWVLREGGLSSVLRGLSSSQGAFLTRCCLSLLSGMMSAWLAWSAKTSVLLFESESEVAQLCLTLCDPMGCIAYQASLSMGFSRQGYWSGLLFPSPAESSRCRDRTQISHIAGRHLTVWAAREGTTLWGPPVTTLS